MITLFDTNIIQDVHCTMTLWITRTLVLRWNVGVVMLNITFWQRLNEYNYLIRFTCQVSSAVTIYHQHVTNHTRRKLLPQISYSKMSTLIISNPISGQKWAKIMLKH